MCRAHATPAHTLARPRSQGKLSEVHITSRSTAKRYATMKAPGAFLRMRRLHVRCNDKSFKALDKLFAHLTASSFPAMHTLIIDITYAAWDGRGLVAVTAPIRELVINDDSVLSERYEHISHMSTLTRLHFKGEPFSRRRRAVRTVNLGGAVSKLAPLQQLRELEFSEFFHSTRGLGALTQLSRLVIPRVNTSALFVPGAAHMQGIDLASDLAPLTGLKTLELYMKIENEKWPRPAPGERLAALDFVSAVPALEDLTVDLYLGITHQDDARRLYDSAGEYALAALPRLRRLRMGICGEPAEQHLPPFVVGGRIWRRTVSRENPPYVVHTPVDV